MVTVEELAQRGIVAPAERERFARQHPVGRRVVRGKRLEVAGHGVAVTARHGSGCG